MRMPSKKKMSAYRIIPQKTEGIFIVEKLKGDTIIATYNVDVPSRWCECEDFQWELLKREKAHKKQVHQCKHIKICSGVTDKYVES